MGIADVIDRLDTDDYPATMVAALKRLVPLELAAIFVNRTRGRPILVFDNFADPRAKKGLATYLDATYVLNPFHQAYLKGLKPGIYRIGDFVPDAFFESEYYKGHKAKISQSEEIGFITDNWPRGMEEANIAIALDDGRMAEIDLFRSARRGGFSDEHLERLRTVEPIVAATFRSYWRQLEARQGATTPDTRIDDCFETFGAPHLSGREREVVQLVLRGHSSESIGYNLEISITTVKTHRRRAYAKLGISSQSELLSLMLASLQAPAAAVDATRIVG